MYLRGHLVHLRFGGYDLMTSICITTSYDAGFRDIGDFAAMTLRYYAYKHGYEAFVDDNVSFERHPSWYRVKLIPDLFTRGFDFVMWVDADAIFVRFDVAISSVITASHDLYMVQVDHPLLSPPMVPNMGVILVRNCAWSRELFTRLWAMDQYSTHNWWENAAMIKLLGYNSLLGEGEDSFAYDLRARIKFLDVEWNSITNIRPVSDPIIRHYAGCTREEREREIPNQALAACFRALRENHSAQAREGTRAHPTESLLQKFKFLTKGFSALKLATK
jgi:hypothetical protein